MIKAIIWDMDGVLIDSESHYGKVAPVLFKQFDIDISDETARNFMGTSFNQYFPRVVKEYGKDIPLEIGIEKYNKIIEDIYENLVYLNPEAKDVLENLKDKYVFALATSTSKNLAEPLLKRLGIIDYFKVKVFGNQIEKSKPAPDIYLEALRQLRIKSSEAIAVEDSFNGISSADSAGLIVIAYKAGHNSNVDFSKADFVTEDLREIPKILEKLNNES